MVKKKKNIVDILEQLKWLDADIQIINFIKNNYK